MPNGTTRKRKTVQKGIQAVFTPPTERKLKLESILGIGALASGAVLWIWSMQSIGVLNADAIIRSVSSSPLLLVTVAMLLSIGGVGLGTYGLAVRRMKRENENMASAIDKLEALMESNGLEPSLTTETVDDSKPFEAPRMPRQISASTAIALAEALLLIIVYGVLVLEYKSNIHMQEWVRSNLMIGQYFLNEAALVFVSWTLGFALVIQWWRQRNSLSTARLN